MHATAGNLQNLRRAAASECRERGGSRGGRRAADAVNSTLLMPCGMLHECVAAQAYLLARHTDGEGPQPLRHLLAQAQLAAVAVTKHKPLARHLQGSAGTISPS